jgi:hypothetical protein
MLKHFILFCVLVGTLNSAYSQTCTISGTSPLNWVNPGPACSEGGNAGGASILVIPAGFTVTFDSNSDTWAGTRIDVYGTLSITKDVTINSSIAVHSGGLLKLESKLFMGSSSGCGYGLSIRPGGTVDVGGTGSDRLSICGVELMKGNGGCNSCGGDNSGDCAYNGQPYCEPTTGFTGPLGYDEDGYDIVLPIKLVSFSASQNSDVVLLNWTTSSQENFDKFIVEHSIDGKNFDTLGVVYGTGNTKLLMNYSITDSNPVIGKNYYRLKSIDYDLTFEYSAVKMAEFKGSKNVIVFPNPASEPFINVHTNFSPQEDDRIEIYDNVGLKLMHFTVAANNNILQFNNKLKHGAYLLRYVSNGHSQVVRFYVK